MKHKVKLLVTDDTLSTADGKVLAFINECNGTNDDEDFYVFLMLKEIVKRFNAWDDAIKWIRYPALSDKEQVNEFLSDLGEKPYVG